MRFDTALAQRPAGDAGAGAARPRRGRARRGRRAGRPDRLRRARRPSCRPARTRAETVDCDGRWITPGPDRLPHPSRLCRRPRRTSSSCGSAGASYEEIARAGGGILSTVRATRAASEDELVAPVAAAPRRADRRGRHHGRDQVRLRARPRDRDARCCAPRAGSAASAPVDGRHDLPRRACAAAGGRRATRTRYHRPGLRRDAAGARGARAWPTRSTRFCEGIAFSPEQIARVFDAAQAPACR